MQESNLTSEELSKARSDVPHETPPNTWVRQDIVTSEELSDLHNRNIFARSLFLLAFCDGLLNEVEIIGPLRASGSCAEVKAV